MEALHFNITDFLWAMLNAVLNYGGGTLTIGVVGVIVDRVIQFIPWAAPWRDVAKQFVLHQLERLQVERTKNVVLEVGQLAKNEAIPLQERRNVAVFSLLARKIAPHDDRAAQLVEQAVASLKHSGVNP
jgi:hypothetical protein